MNFKFAKMSPKFSTFRGILDTWDNYLENERLTALKLLLNSASFAFYFENAGEYFAGPEESRIVFATLKKPDKELPKAWKEEASFEGVNLSSMLKQDEPVKRTFYHKDIKDINVLDKSELEKKLNV